MGEEVTARSRPRALSPERTCLSVGVAPDELALLAAAAEVSSMPTSSWVRYQALRVAAGVSRAPGPFKPRATRPSTAKLTQTASAHFTDEQYEAIVEHARACGLTVGGLIRRLVLGCEPIAHQPVVRSAIAAVHRAGGNLLQLIHPAGGGVPLTPDLMRAVADLRTEIHALREALLRADAAGAPDPAE
jgi:hypothetical protein